MDKPPFIGSQTIRVLHEREGIKRYLRPEALRIRRFSASDQRDNDRDAGTWDAVDRETLPAKILAKNSDFRRVILTTDAGIGKTTNMQWLHNELNRSAGASALAILVSVAELPPSSSLEAIHAVLIKKLRLAVSRDVLGETMAQAFLDRLRKCGRLILLLEALDQISDAASIETLKTLLTDVDWKNCPMVVSGRPYALIRHERVLFGEDWQREAKWRVCQLDEFSEEEQKNYLGAFKDGVSRWEAIPEEARPILSVPRVLRYLRPLAKERFEQITTAADVFAFSIERMITKGLRDEKARRMGVHPNDSPPSKATADQRQLTQTLLAATAMEMTSRTVTRWKNGVETTVPNFDRLRADRRFRNAVFKRCKTYDEFYDRARFDRDFDCLGPMNAVVDHGFLDVDGQEINDVLWRDRSLQEFMTAYYLANYCEGEADVRKLRQWIYLSHDEATHEYE